MAEPMKVRAQLTGDTADIKLVISHPMETGQRKDPKTNQIIPAHYILTLSVSVNGKTVLNSHCGPSISKNPFLGIRVRGVKAGDKVAVQWEDSKGEKNTAETVIG